MPTFEFTSPAGKTYEISGPEGATKEQAWGILQQQLGSEKKAPAAAEAPAPSPVENAASLPMLALAKYLNFAKKVAENPPPGVSELASTVKEQVEGGPNTIGNRVMRGDMSEEDAAKLTALGGFGVGMRGVSAGGPKGFPAPEAPWSYQSPARLLQSADSTAKAIAQEAASVEAGPSLGGRVWGAVKDYAPAVAIDTAASAFGIPPGLVTAAKYVANQAKGKAPPPVEAAPVAPRPGPTGPTVPQAPPEGPLPTPWGVERPQVPPMADLVHTLNATDQTGMGLAQLPKGFERNLLAEASAINKITKKQDGQVVMEAMPLVKQLARQAKREPYSPPQVSDIGKPWETPNFQDIGKPWATPQVGEGVSVPLGLPKPAWQAPGITEAPQRPPIPMGAPAPQLALPAPAPVSPVAAIQALTRVNGSARPKTIMPSPKSELENLDIPAFLRRDAANKPPVTKEITQADRLASMKAAQDKEVTVTSQDGQRDLNLLHHTSADLPPAEAAAHIADNMGALGKPVRDKGDFVSFIEPFIATQDKLALDLSKVMNIAPEKLIAHMRSVGSQTNAKAWREDFMAHEPTLAGQIAKVMSDQRIKHAWRKK